MANGHDLTELEDIFKQVSRKISLEWSKHVEQQLSGSQAMILEILESEGPQKLSSLAEALGITSGAVTALADKLIYAGLAKRKRTEDDRRIVFLEITQKGREALRTVRERRKSILTKFFSGLPEDDIRHLIRIYKQVLQNIEQL